MMSVISHTRQRLAMLADFALAVLEIIGLVLAWKEMGSAIWRYFVSWSNALCLLSAVAYFLSAFVGHGKVAQSVALLRYAASVSVTLTFAVSACVLAPKSGDWITYMLSGSSLFLRCVAPLLSVLSFLLLENGKPLKAKDQISAVTMPLAYAAVLTTLNYTKLLEGPYFFLFVYRQPLEETAIWVGSIIGAAVIFSALLRCLFRPKR